MSLRFSLLSSSLRRGRSSQSLASTAPDTATSRRYRVSSSLSSLEKVQSSALRPGVALFSLGCFLGLQYVVPALWVQSASAEVEHRAQAIKVAQHKALLDGIKAQEKRNPKAPKWFLQAQRHEQLSATGRGSRAGEIEPSAPLYDPNPRVSLKAMNFSQVAQVEAGAGLGNYNASGIASRPAPGSYAGKFSGVPSTQDISRSGGDCGALVPKSEADPQKAAAALEAQSLQPGDPSDVETIVARQRAAVNVANLSSENLSFAQAMETWNEKNFQPAVAMLQEHVRRFPDSPWATEAKLHIADDSQFTGRYSDAVAIYNQVFNQTMGANGQRPKVGTPEFELHYKTLQKWVGVNLILGRFDEAKKQVDEMAANDPQWRRWTWANYWQNQLQLYQQNRLALHTCGGMALYAVLQDVGKSRGAERLVTQNAPNANGYSLAEMQTLGRKYGVEFKGFRARPEQLVALPMPLIIHCDYHASEKVGKTAGSATTRVAAISKGVTTRLVTRSSALMNEMPGMVGMTMPVAGVKAASAKNVKSTKVAVAAISKTGTLLQCPQASVPNCATCATTHGHYYVVQRVDDKRGLVYLYNPQVQSSYVLPYADLAKDWSGTGLVIVPRNTPSAASSIEQRAAGLHLNGQAGLQRVQVVSSAPSSTRFAWLSSAEMKSIRGGCYVAGAQSGLGGNGANGPVCVPCGGQPYGSPAISVNQISQNMLIVDTPVWYHPAMGPKVDVTMSFNSQDGTNYYQPFGNKWSFGYSTHLTENTAGTVVVFMADGRQDTFAPTTGGNYTHPVGVYNTLVKTGANAFELRFPEGGKYVYTVPQNTTSTKPLLTRIEDRWGYGLTMGYDANLNLNTITDATNQVTTLTYNNANRIVMATVPDGRFATWRYDAYGNMIEVTDVEGHAFQYTYDSTVNLVQLNTAQGPWKSNYFYDNSGYGSPSWGSYSTTITDPLGNVEKFNYNGDHAYTGLTRYTHTDKRGLTTGMAASTIIDGQGKIDSVIAPNGDTIRTVYDAATGQPSSVTDAGSRTTSFTYNALGRPLTVTDAKGHTTKLNYAANNIDVTSVQDTLNNTVATLTYNAFHQPTSVTNRLNQTTSTTYALWGAPGSMTDAANHTTSYNYNSNGTMASFSYDGTTLGSSTYDASNRVASSTGADGLTVSYQYNNLDHITRTTYPDGTYSTTDYVCCGMPGVVRDRSGRKTYYDYDPMKRLVRKQDAQGNSVSYDHDPNGNLIRLLDGKGSSTRWHYDSLNRRDKKTYIDGTYNSYAYDLVANTVSRTDAKGQTTVSSYDAAGNLTKIDYPTMPDMTMQYDALNRVASMTDALGTRTYGYDNLNRVTSVGGIYVNDALTYHYDTLGRRDQMSVQNGASSGTTASSYGYDALSRLSTLTSPVGTWNYAYVGNTQMLNSLAKPNGTVSSYSYDGMDRMTQVQNKNSMGSILSNYVYGYDNRDVRTSMERTMGNSSMQHVDYAYDSTSQLTGEVASETQPLTNVPYVNNGFAYDAMGNRSSFGNTQLPSGGNTVSQSTSTVVNRLNQLTSQTLATSVNGVPSSTRTDSFSYDPNGNQDTQSNNLDSANTSYVYDEADRLIQVVQKDTNGVNSHKSEFVYDGLGRKAISREYSWGGGAWQLVPNSEVRRIYSGLNVIQERDANNNILVNYTRDGNIGGILAKTDSTGNYFFNYDGHGNVTQLTDAGQNSVAEYFYDAYGNTLRVVGTQAAGNAYRYSTKEWNNASGLYDYGFRFYAPSLGRWINRDPIREYGGLNLYGFNYNDPVNRTDFYGHGSLERWMYTGDWNASDDVYNAGLNGAGEWVYNCSPVRGGYVSGGLGNFNKGGVTGGANVTGGWTVDNGVSGSVSGGVGIGVGETSAGETGKYGGIGDKFGVGVRVGVGYSEGKGIQGGGGFTGGVDDSTGGFWVSDPNNGGKPSLRLGVSKGRIGAGIIVDPEKLGNFLDGNCPCDDSSADES